MDIEDVCSITWKLKLIWFFLQVTLLKQNWSSTSTDQRLSKLDTRSLASRALFWRPFWKLWNTVYPESLYRSLGPFSLFKNSTLADKIQFTFNSSLCTISSSIWCHTSGENSDTNGGTNQQQQVSHCLPVCLVRRSTCKLSLTFQDKVQL